MNTDQHAPARLYLAIDGKPQGPHTAAYVMKMWQEGLVQDDTLICPDGGAAWVTMKAFEPALRAELPPIPPAGYGTPHTGAARPEPASAPRPAVAAKSADTTAPVRIGALLGAAVFFFLPWVELRCQGQRFVYQSGVQTVINQMSPDETFVAAAGGSREKLKSEDAGEKSGYAFLAGGGLLCLLLAIGTAFRRSGRQMSGLLAAVALACLVLEAVVGFPLERAVKRELRGNIGNFAAFNPMNPLSEQVPGMKILGGMGVPPVTVKYSGWFYAELAALGLAAFVGLRR
jgi:hypothetical protein